MKVFPLDRVEDRNGNYMHIDYGGSHAEIENLDPFGNRSGTYYSTVASSYGSAVLPNPLPGTSGRQAVVAQGVRPELEMYPRRFTYGMRTATPGSGHNQASVGEVEIARVMLNYELRNDVTRSIDTASSVQLSSKRLASIVSLVGGIDDTSTRPDRDNFHYGEAYAYNYGNQCRTGSESGCGTELRRYNLSYGYSQATGRSRLNSVQECYSSASTSCLAATNFAWQDDVEPSFNSASDTYNAANNAANPPGFSWNYVGPNGRVADIVGDGRTRLVKRVDNTQLAVCEYNVNSQSNANKFVCANWLVGVPAGKFIPDAKSTTAWHLADLNGDGIADLVVVDNDAGFACITQTTSTTGLALSNGALSSCALLPAVVSNGNVRLNKRLYSKVGDFDADGRMDVVFYRGDGNFEFCRYGGGLIATTANWTCSAPIPVLNFAYSSTGADEELKNVIIADFNGDGRSDIAMRAAPECVNGTSAVSGTPPGTQCLTPATESSKYWSVCFATGSFSNNTFALKCSSRSGAGIGGAVPAVSGKISKIATYDFNGDGLADLAQLVPGQGWRVCLSTGDGEFAGRNTNGQLTPRAAGEDCPIWGGPSFEPTKTVAGDFNGDGRTDVAGYVRNGATGSGVGIWQVCLSTGSGFACTERTGPPRPADGASCGPDCFEAFAGDFNGDGKSDLVVNAKAENGIPGEGNLYYGISNAVMPDLISSVTTGLGAVTKVSYVPLSNSGGVYQKQLGGSSDPDFSQVLDNEIVIQSPMYVVASTLASTGLTDQFYKSRYYYESLRADKFGRGLYGFYRRSIVDNLIADGNGSEALNQASTLHATGILNSQQWPNVGRPLAVSKQVGGTLVSNVINVYGRRCRDAAGTLLSACPTVATPKLRWEAFQTLSVQNPRYKRATTTDPSTYNANGYVRELGTTNVYLPTTITYTGIDPLADAVADPTGGPVNLATYYDTFGNPLQVTTRTLHPTNGEVWQQAVTNNYFNAANGGGDTTRWLLGKLANSSTTSTVTGYTTYGSTSVTRKSSFTYHGIDTGSCTGAVAGQLCTETVEPTAATGPDKSLYQQSAYEYDAFGNRNKSTVSFYNDNAATGGLQTRSSGTTYQYGKYPLTNTRYFGSVPDPTKDLADTREYTDARCRMPTKVTDANGNYATTGYDGFCRKVHESAFAFDGVVGRLVKQSTYTLTTAGINAANGEQYAMETSSSEITDVDRRVSVQFYDNLQRTVRAQARRYVSNGGWDTAEARTFFDAYGRQRCTAKQVAGGTVSATTCGGVAWTVATGSAVTRMDYDALNRVTTETLPDGNTVTTTYAGLTTTVTRSNSNGTTGTNNSAQAHATTKTANAKGLVATVTTSPIATTVSYFYDAIGNLTQVDSPAAGVAGSKISKFMEYDVRGRQTKLTDPDAGTYSYTYNGVGEQVSQTDSRTTPSNFVTTTTYDAFGRKQTRTETHPLTPGSTSTGTASTEWVYGLDSDPDSCANAKGLLCTVRFTTPDGKLTRKATTYDIYSRPVATTTEIDNQRFTSQVAYDGLGRPKHAVYPQATANAAPLALTTTYNSAGFTTDVNHASTGLSYWKLNGRTVDGQLATATVGGVLTHNNSYSGDGLARIATINILSGATNLLSQSFTFESVGNLNSRGLVSPAGAGLARNESESFGYDALDRLTQNIGSGIAANDSGSYSTDSAGNLTSKAGLPLVYATGSNRLCAIGIGASGCGTGTGAITYDGNGNILAYTRPTAAQSNNAPGADGALLQLTGYTAFNLPTSITKSLPGTGGAIQASAEFFYDAGYQRTRQIKRSGPAQTGSFVNDILYVVPGGFEVHRNEAGQVISSIATVSGPDGVVATVTTSLDAITGAPVVGAGQAANTTNLSGITTVTKLLLKDHLGSMVAEFTLTSATTGTLAVHGFGPWGNARNAANPLNGDQRGFTGHEHLAELGIIHMNGRLYDAVLGRFLQADPIIQAPHNAQSHNRYSYVLNNPLSFTDPSGFSAWTKWRRTVFAIAAAVIMPYLAAEFIFAQAAAGAEWALGMTTIVTNSAGVGVAGLTTGGNFVAAVAGGFASGGIAGGNIQSALQGALTAGLTFGVGEFSGAHDAGGSAAMSTGQRAGQIAGHAAVGCGSAAMAGGSCRSGAMSAGFSAFAGHVPGVNQLGLVARVAVGAVASRLGGGKAENGALSAAFQYLFNEVGSSDMRRAT